MKKTNPNCPISSTIDILSDFWTMHIVYNLQDNSKRFCDLEKSLEGISTRTLTLKLKKLQEEKMLEKNNDGSYELTDKGHGLKTVIDAMRKYGEKYLI
ncbi:MAG: hypothetical protein COX80_00780 [Candidatus Magasanikbacteria bacterium CG_4_10_14_0_2_um_filter_33_14]|uniref:HTH hxlR-type domain-containing protein n=1 Tax=Candidatus Magasanikbacteria bacterium CG_4_10_14_0_2_um_filter_33_14 TaxID=1974636 RepID=A0A2M7VBQ6_9BACT|nr:MAG: hypothetical protein COX80_00780 [Candidatus Magasanikbacteria bacterium CG_4_10_14_0_2_um_filter_33_14]